MTILKGALATTRTLGAIITPRVTARVTPAPGMIVRNIIVRSMVALSIVAQSILALSILALDTSVMTFMLCTALRAFHGVKQ